MKMKNKVYRPAGILILLLTLYSTVLAQTWHLASTRSVDMKTHSASKSKVFMNIDSATMEMHIIDQYYDHKVEKFRRSGDQVLFYLSLNGRQITGLLDKKAKTFDYSMRLSEAVPTTQTTRYFLDSIIEKLPPVPDSIRRRDSLKNLKGKTAWSEAGIDSTTSAKPAEDTVVLESADKMPEYPGGKAAMMDFIKKHVHYPKEAARDEKKGFVVLKVVIEKDGRIGPVYIKRSLGDACNQEAIKAVSKMPKWQPGSNADEPRRIFVEIPVSFFPGADK